MRYGIAVTDSSNTEEIERSGRLLLEKLHPYIRKLDKITTVHPPRGIVFHDFASATEIFSTTPLPAYTSRELIHIDPTVKTWKRLFLSTARNLERVETYYHELTVEDVAVIAAHEWTHHAEIFQNERKRWGEESEDMWFEEGLCFYLPRRVMLSKERFNDLMEVERMLIDRYKTAYGEYSIARFGESGEKGSELSSAFYDYWRSTRIISILVDSYCGGNLRKLITLYREWAGSSKDISLQTFFVETFGLSKREAEILWLHS